MTRATRIPDVVIDFSSPAGTETNAKRAEELKIALVIGTTAKDFEWRERVKASSGQVPMIHAQNFSLGVNLMFKFSAMMAKALGEDFDIEIVESHHHHKVDAPSGTGMGIAGAICSAIDRDVKKDLVYGREGQVGKRTQREIGVHALRMGSEIGLHTVYYQSEFEHLELTHRAQVLLCVCVCARARARIVRERERERESLCSCACACVMCACSPVCVCLCVCLCVRLCLCIRA